MKDLIDATLYIGEQAGNFDRGAEILIQIRAACRQLAEFPRMGRTRDELRRRLRSYAVPPFTIFYRVRRSHVDVTRIVHDRRDVRQVFPPTKRKR